MEKVFVIATMGLFSGDGAGVLGRLLEKYGAEILGGLHLKMPDSISDEKVLKRPLEKNMELGQSGYSQSASLLAHNLHFVVCQVELALHLTQASPLTPT